MCFTSAYNLESQFPSLTLVSVGLVSIAWTVTPRPLSLWFRSFTVFSCIVTGMKKTANKETWLCVKAEHAFRFLIFTNMQMRRKENKRLYRMHHIAKKREIHKNINNGRCNVLRVHTARTTAMGDYIYLLLKGDWCVSRSEEIKLHVNGGLFIQKL